MPSSASESIPYIIEFTRKNKPSLKTVLDVGIGFGKDGFLMREYFDVKEWHKFQPDDWLLKITGVDIYDGYLSAIQKIIYNDIIIGDIRDVMPNLGSYDLAILSDVLEHFDKKEGHKLLKDLFFHVSDIVIATPLGYLDHPAEGNNPYEAHKSGWTLADFSSFTILDSAIIKRIRKPEQLLVVYLRNPDNH